MFHLTDSKGKMSTLLSVCLVSPLIESQVSTIHRSFREGVSNQYNIQKESKELRIWSNGRKKGPSIIYLLRLIQKQDFFTSWNVVWTRKLIAICVLIQ